MALSVCDSRGLLKVFQLLAKRSATNVDSRHRAVAARLRRLTEAVRNTDVESLASSAGNSPSELTRGLEYHSSVMGPAVSDPRRDPQA